MLKKIKVSDQEIAYEIKKSARARRVSLRVHGDGTVTLTVPRRVPNLIAEKFLRSKANWILRGLRRVSDYSPLPIGVFDSDKKKALLLINEKLQNFNAHYDYAYKKVSVRKQRTKWGSCSARGNLSFNYKIIYLPPLLADYLIVHELCHLRHMNHSAGFWGDVARTIPDYKKRKQELRKFVL